MSKSLNRCILAVVCIALVCALGLSLLFIGGETTVVAPQEGQAASTAQNTNTYTHGSNTRNHQSGGTAISNATALRNMLTSGGSGIYYLTKDIDNLGSWSFTSATFSGTLYGNGYTITFSGPSTGNVPTVAFSNTQNYWGSIAGTLTGAIYDLNVHMNGGQVNIGRSGNNSVYVGGMVGYLKGGIIDNCTFTLTSKNDARIGALKESSPGWGGSHAWTGVGGVAGIVAANSRITNVTANINGWLEAGTGGGTGGASVTATTNSTAGNLVGYYEGGSNTVNNIVITNSGSSTDQATLKAQYTSNLGMLASANSSIAVTNFYNNWRENTASAANFQGDTNGSSVTFAHFIDGSYLGTGTVANYYLGNGAINSISNSTGQPTGIANGGTINVPSGTKIYFDPTKTDYTKALAIEFSETYSSTRTYTLTGANNSTVSGATFESNAAGNVVARNLPTSASTWGTTFTASLSSRVSVVATNPALTKYEHGYLSSGSPSGTAISTAQQFEGIFAPTGTLGSSSSSSGSYYLTSDITITGFTGKTFSGTLDGNGKTISIVACNTAAGGASMSGDGIGGLIGLLNGNGVIKNVRVVIYNDIEVTTSAANAYIGSVVGKMEGNASLQNVQVVIKDGATLSTNRTSDNKHAMGGVVGRIANVSSGDGNTGVTLTNVTLQLDGTLAPKGQYTYEGGIVGLIETGAPVFNNIIVRGNGSFAGTANNSGQPPYIGAVGVLKRESVTSGPSATIDGFIYDANITLTGSASSYGVFSNNWSDGTSNLESYKDFVSYNNIFNVVGSDTTINYNDVTNRGNTANGNAIVPIGDDTTIKNISANVSGVTGSTVKAYFMPGTAASPNLTLVAAEPSSGWSDVERLQLNDQSNLFSTNDGTNKVVNVAKTTAESMSGENLTLSPYNPYTVITASLENATVTYSGSPYVAQVKFTLADGSSTPVTIDTNSYTITYGADDGNTGETNVGSNYQVTIKLKTSIADNDNSGKTYAFDINGGLSTTLYYEITKKTVSLASNLATTLGGTFGDLQYTGNSNNSTFTPVISEDVNLFVDTDGNPVTFITAADYRVFAMCGTSFPTTESGLIPAGTYSYNVQFTSAGSNNYQFSSGSGVEGISGVTIDRYALTGTWSLDPDFTITYGDPIPNYDQYIDVVLTNAGTIPGGLTGVTANGFTADYEQGTTGAGTTVNLTPGSTYNVIGEGAVASNYDFSGIAGSGSFEVQKREITISAADIDPAVGHIVAIYGGENYVSSQADLQALLTWNAISSYVQNVYNNDEIGFTITQVAHEQTGEEATYAPGEPVQEGEWAKLPAKETYYITVTSANNNYTVAADNYFKYQVKPVELSVTGVVWDDTGLDTITYDGQDHNYTVKTTGLVNGDNLDDVISTSVKYNNAAHAGNIIDAGTYTVTVELKEGGNYDLDLTGAGSDLTLTISPITFTVQNASATFTQYTDSNEAAKVLEDMIVAGDTLPDGELSTVVSGQILNPEHSGGYLAFKRGGYTVNFAIKTGYATNYAIAGAASATLTINSYDLANATIEVNPDSNTYTYNGKTQTVPVTVTTSADDGRVDIFDFVTITGNTQKNAGENYQVTVSGNSSNISGEQRTAGTWSIAKATITIEGTDALTSEYSGEAVDPATLLSATYITVSGAASGEDVYSMLTATSADGEILNYKEGGYTVNIALDEMKEGASNYEISGGTVSVTYTVTKKAVTIEWTIGDIIQGTAPDKVKDTAKVTDNGGILDGDKYTFTVTLPLKDGSGDYTTTTPAGKMINVTPSLTFTDPTDAGNYNITYNPEILEWTVQQPEVAISVTALTVDKTYAAGFVTEDEFLSNFTGTFTATNAEADLTSDNFDITITKQGEGEPTAVGVGRLDVGTYTVTISLAADSQYTIATDSTFIYTYTVTAEQWTATVAAPEGGLTYNGLDQFSSLVITPGEANNTCDGAPTIAAVVTGEMKNAGTYTVTLKLQTADGEAYEGGNFVLTADSAQIEIAKLKVKITWAAENGDDLVYDGQAHTLTATITNKVETDNVTAIVEKHTGDNTIVTAGGFSYTITGLENNELGNYTLEGVSNITSQAFYISPATLTVEENVAFKFNEVVVGELLSTIGSQVVTGAMNNDELANIVTMTVPEGISTVTWKGVEYYSASNIGSTMTVTIISDNYTFAGSAKEAKVTLSIVKLDDTITISETKTAYYYDVYKRDEATGSDNFFTVSTVSGLPVQITYYNGGDGSSPYDSLNSGDYISFDVTSTNIAVINITPTEDELSVNFNITPQRVTYTVVARPVNVAIDLTDVNPTYTGTAFSIPNEAVTVTDSDGTPSQADVSGQILVLMQGASDAEGANAVVNAGAYTVSAKSESSNVVINDTTFEGDVNTVTIAPAAIDVTLAQTEFTYGDTIDLGATVTAIEGTDDVIGVQIKNIVMDGAEDTGATVTNFLNAGAGTYFVTFELTGDDAANYELSATSNPATVTINRKQVTITWAGVDGASDNFTYTYDGTAKVPTASVVGAVDESHFTNINEKVTIGGALTDEKAINAGSYTATITKVAFETAYPNYTIAEDSERGFVINPQTVTVTMTMKDAENSDVTSPLTWNVNSAIVVERAENVWTLTSGDTVYTITVTGFESVVGFNSSKLELHLNDDEYTGTPYGTPVTDGELGIVSADPNYEISTTNPIRFNVVPSLAIELAEGAEISVVYGVNKSYDAAADTNNAFAQYFTVQTSDGSVAPAGTWSYTVVGENQAQTIQDVGTYTIEATYIVTDGGATLKNSIKFSITAAQVSDVTLGTITYGDLSKTGDTITATITYADGTSVDAELGYTAEDITAGDGKSITLGAYTNENANYAGFERRDVTVTIEKKAVTVTVTPASTTYTGSDIALGVEIDGAVYEEELAVTFGANIESAATQSTTMTVRNAGTYNVHNFNLTLGGSEASNYYVDIANSTSSFTINPAPVTVEVTPEYTSYRGVEIALSGTITDGVFGTDEVSVGVITTNNTVRDAGTYTITGITLTGAAANNYVMSAASTSSFTIAKAEATLSIANYATINGQEYNGQPVTITPEMTVGGVSLPTDGIVKVSINDTTDYPGTATDQILYAGSYTVTLSVDGDNNIEDTSVNFTVTIAKKAVRVITDDTSEYSYDGTAKDLNERVAEAGVIGDDEVTAMVASIVDESGTTVTELKNADTYTVTFGLSGDDARNYVIAEKYGSMTVTINRATVTVTVTAESDTYTGSNITVNGTINGKVEGDEVSATITTTVRNAGTYTITAEDIALTGAAAANYTVDSVTDGSFTIAPATVTVTVTPASTTYTGSNITVNGTINGKVEGDEVSATITTTVRNAGTYTITAEDIALTGAAAANYTVGSFTESITIAPATATLNEELLEGLVATYGDIIASDGVLTGGFSETVFVTAGDTELEVTITITPVTREPLAQGAIYVGAGSYILTVEIEDTNYAFEEGVVNTVALTVQAKPLDLSVTIPDTTYSSTGVAVNLNDFAEQIVGDDSVDVTIYVTDASGKEIEYTNNTVLNAGTYTVSYEVDSANYAVSVPEEPVTITIAPQAVQAPDRVIVGGSTTVEKNEETGQLELDIAAGEAVNLEQTINNVLSSNHGTTNNDYTITVTDKDGNAVEGADISNLGTLTEGEYTVSVEMSNSNYSGGMTFVVTVSSGSILTPENPPAGLPETPLGGVAEADGNDWLFPVLVAVVALIDICLLAAICIVAKIKRDRNKA